MNQGVPLNSLDFLLFLSKRGQFSMELYKHRNMGFEIIRVINTILGW